MFYIFLDFKIKYDPVLSYTIFYPDWNKVNPEFQHGYKLSLKKKYICTDNTV